MKIVAVSDLHGALPELPAADIICIAGDIIPRQFNKDIPAQWSWFNNHYLPWVESLPTRKVITVAGNHDKFRKHYGIISNSKHIYLENSGIEIDGFTFYGTPEIARLNDDLSFKPINEKLERIFGKIPNKLDFLICHSAPFGTNGCGVWNYGVGGAEDDPDSGRDIGCRELAEAIKDKQIGWIFCGHIHTGNHSPGVWRGKNIVNVSYASESAGAVYGVFEMEITPPQTAPL